MLDYLPHFFTTDGRKWNILSMHVCVDFGGRQMQLETRCCGEWNLTKSFVYYYLTDEFKQWDHTEGVDASPEKGAFTESIRYMFDKFSV